MVHIAGVGPGNPELITPAAMGAIEACDVLIGGKRNLELFGQLKKERVTVGGDLEPVCAYIRENAGKKRIVVLATGDPGVFSIADYLRRRLPELALEVIPGISSLQYLCGRLGMSWHDMAVISLHGREDADPADAITANFRTAVFTGGGVSPGEVCRRLMERGVGDLAVTVGERLSYPEERIVSGTAGEISEMQFDSLSLMIIERGAGTAAPGEWQYKTPGIPDGLFVRGDVPMTKEEVRTISVAKLRLREDSTVLDIGAGTGSVTVECALLCARGRIFAVERDREALELIRKNLERFKTGNVLVIEGEAPECLDGLPPPDRVFVGGTGGRMDPILRWIAKNPGETRVVVNAVSPETVYEALAGLEKWGFREVELMNLAVSKGLRAGGKHVMRAQNPISIISARKAEAE